MRVVALADTHMFERELGGLPEGDVLVHAGDLLRRGTLEELEAVVPWLRAQPHRHKILVAGNHDGCFEHDRARAVALLGPDVIYLQDEAVLIDGFTFYGSPWQPAYNDWAFNLERGEPLRQRWALIPEGVDVLITHVPPRGFGDRSSIGGRHGCDDLREAVRRVAPRLHLFGHIHNDGGSWREADTLYANVTTWECDRAPSVFDVTARDLIEVSIPAADPFDAV